MNDEDKRWQLQLEQATSRCSATERAEDAETAALREGWTSLTRLLEAADRDFDASSVATLVAPVARSTRHVWGTLVSLAAALLLAVMTGWAWQRYHHTPLPEAPQIVESSPQPKRADSPKGTTESGDLLWNDSWDEKLARIDQAIVGLDSSTTTADGAVNVLDSALRSFGQDLKNEL
jgi:hypothetical protein